MFYSSKALEPSQDVERNSSKYKLRSFDAFIYLFLYLFHIDFFLVVVVSLGGLSSVLYS